MSSHQPGEDGLRKALLPTSRTLCPPGSPRTPRPPHDCPTSGLVGGTETPERQQWWIWGRVHLLPLGVHGHSSNGGGALEEALGTLL